MFDCFQIVVRKRVPSEFPYCFYCYIELECFKGLGYIARKCLKARYEPTINEREVGRLFRMKGIFRVRENKPSYVPELGKEFFPVFEFVPAEGDVIAG